MNDRRDGYFAWIAFSAKFGLPVTAAWLGDWVVVGLSHRAFGAAPALVVGTLLGAAAWWTFAFVWQRRFERAVEERFGPRADAELRGIGAQMAWLHVGPWAKTWQRLLIGYVLLGPLLVIALHG